MKQKKTPNWGPLFTSNFLSVFNDNLLKYCIIFSSIHWILPSNITQSQVISIISGALILPYLFFSPLAGYLASQYSKLSIFKYCKLLEIFILVIACFAIYNNYFIASGISVLIMGIISCMYSPAKYGLIRDIGGENKVSYGSGIFEMMSFMGILLGTLAAAYLSDLSNTLIIGCSLLVVATLGYMSTNRISVVENSDNCKIDKTFNPITFCIESYRIGKLHTHLNRAIFGAASFWLIGSLLQMNIVIHSQHIYHLSNSSTGLVISIAAIGIALGTFTAGKISTNKVRLGLVLYGLIGMIVTLGIILSFKSLNLIHFELCIFIFSFFGGIFQIPCLATIQKAALGHDLGKIIGFLNIITFLFILIGSGIFSLLTGLSNENSYVVFLGIVIFTLILFLYFSLISKDFITDSIDIIKSNKQNEAEIT